MIGIAIATPHQGGEISKEIVARSRRKGDASARLRVVRTVARNRHGVGVNQKVARGIEFEIGIDPSRGEIDPTSRGARVEVVIDHLGPVASNERGIAAHDAVRTSGTFVAGAVVVEETARAAKSAMRGRIRRRSGKKNGRKNRIPKLSKMHAVQSTFFSYYILVSNILVQGVYER